jgi:hypothetical protein
LVRLARSGLFRAHWTSDIHEEWIRSVLEMRPDLSRERLVRTRDLMNEHVLDSLVTDYEKHIPTIVLPDADDRHIVAAAIEAKANLIITFNLKHFPASALEPINLTAVHLDDFVTGLLDIDEPVVLATVRDQRLDLKRPPSRQSNPWIHWSPRGCLTPWRECVPLSRLSRLSRRQSTPNAYRPAKWTICPDAKTED